MKQQHWWRVTLTLMLLVQLAAGAIVRLSHMPDEGRSLTHKEHIQAPGENPCRTHSDSDCQICRAAQVLPLTTVVRARLQIPGTTPRIHFAAHERSPSECSYYFPLGSRAPPLL